MAESSSSARPTPEQLAHYAEEFNKSLSMKHFGCLVSFPSGERVRVVIDPLRPEHRGGLGTSAVNGGVLAAMFDLVLGCTPALIDPTRRNATVQLSMSFERPLAGNVLVAEAWITTSGASTVFSQAEIRDGRGQVCARAQGVIRVSKLSWESGSSPAVN
jgi:acyl-coenzyme A thioesterase PaaI-like protein